MELTRISNADRIIITESKVLSIDASVKRAAGFDEVSKAYKGSLDFRNELYHVGPVWVNKMGLMSRGPHRITEDGTHVKISDREYFGLFPEERAWHYPGEGQVAVNIDWKDMRYGRLDVYAGLRPDFVARVALVGSIPAANAVADKKELKSALRE